MSFISRASRVPAMRTFYLPLPFSLTSAFPFWPSYTCVNSLPLPIRHLCIQTLYVNFHTIAPYALISLTPLQCGALFFSIVLIRLACRSNCPSLNRRIQQTYGNNEFHIYRSTLLKEKQVCHIEVDVLVFNHLVFLLQIHHKEGCLQTQNN